MVSIRSRISSRDLAKFRGALPGAGPAPDLEAALGGGEGAIEILGRGIADRADGVFRRRIMDGLHSARAGRRPGAIDIELQVLIHDRLRFYARCGTRPVWLAGRDATPVDPQIASAAKSSASDSAPARPRPSCRHSTSRRRPFRRADRRPHRPAHGPATDRHVSEPLRARLAARRRVVPPQTAFTPLTAEAS